MISTSLLPVRLTYTATFFAVDNFDCSKEDNNPSDNVFNAVISCELLAILPLELEDTTISAVSTSIIRVEIYFSVPHTSNADATHT